MSIGNDLVLAQQLEELQGALKRAQSAQAKEKLKTDQIVAAVYQAAKDAAVAIKPPKVTKPKKDTRKNKAEVALIHATDWQLGKKTASYGVETCGARMEKFVEKVLHITQIQRKHHPVREAVLMLGGDMVEGLDIFPGQAWDRGAPLRATLRGGSHYRAHGPTP